MQIGFIGLGQMGKGIAENLIKAGHAVTVWNRSPVPAQELKAKGARVAATPDETLKGEVLFSVLANDAAMRELGLAGALLSKAANGLIHINMATISVALAEELAAAHAQAGVGYIAAPVFGRPDAAAAGQLLIAAAGEDASFDKVSPLLDAVGRKTVRVGKTPAQANLFKIAGNFMIASALETMSEAFALLAKGGVDPAQFHAVMTGSLFAAPIYANYGKLVLEKKFDPAGFQLKLGLKDVNLAREAAAQSGAALPLGDLMKAHLDDAVAAGLGDKDWTAVSTIIAKKSGL